MSSDSASLPEYTNLHLLSTLRECADDLENEIKHTYDGLLNYPHNQVKFERDMEVVTRARDAIATVSELIAALEYIVNWKADRSLWNAETARDQAVAALAKAKGVR